MPTDNRHTQQVPGAVLSIRLDSADIMACIDAAEQAEVALPGMSLSQVVKWGLVVMAQTLRESNVLPTRDGFEYSQMIDRYKRSSAGVKTKTGIMMTGQEVNLKSSGRSVALANNFAPAQSAARGDDGQLHIGSVYERQDNGLVIPDYVRVKAPCGQQDVLRINDKITSKREAELEIKDIAFWLMYCPDRGVATMRIPRDRIAEAEHLIKGLPWPDYRSILEQR